MFDICKLNNYQFMQLANQMFEEFVKKENILFVLKNSAPFAVDLNDTLYIEQPKKRAHIKIATTHGDYEYIDNRTEIFDRLEQMDNGFKKIGYGLMANLDRVSSYDSYYNLIYFNDSDIKLNVTATTINFLKDKLGKENDRNVKNTSDYLQTGHNIVKHLLR